MSEPVPAIRKVQDALAALPSDTIGPRSYIDRSESNPLQADELPGRVIRVVDVAFELTEGMTLHRVTFQIDFLSGNNAWDTIDLINQCAIAEFIASIHADRTLGGMLQSLEEQNTSGSERAGADTGAAILQVQALFFTPRGDFYTIVGQAGAHF